MTASLGEDFKEIAQALFEYVYVQEGGGVIEYVKVLQALDEARKKREEASFVEVFVGSRDSYDVPKLDRRDVVARIATEKVIDTGKVVADEAGRCFEHGAEVGILIPDHGDETLHEHSSLVRLCLNARIRFTLASLARKEKNVRWFAADTLKTYISDMKSTRISSELLRVTFEHVDRRLFREFAALSWYIHNYIAQRKNTAQ